MDPDEHVYSPLLPDVLRAANAVSDNKSLSRFKPGSTLTFTVLLTFARPATATSGEVTLAEWQRYRRSLGFRSGQQVGMFETKPENLLPQFHDNVTISIDPYDYGPLEFCQLAREMVRTRLHFFPILRSIYSALQKFEKTFADLEILRVGTAHDHDWLSAIEDGHHLLRKLATVLSRLVIPEAPIDLVIDGSVKSLSISVNDVPVSLSEKKRRGVLALALLPYDRWFSLDTFCRIGFRTDTYDRKKQFDAALSDLKQYQPFDWDADEGLRRIKGVVIRSLVERRVLRAHLNWLDQRKI